MFLMSWTFCQTETTDIVSNISSIHIGIIESLSDQDGSIFSFRNICHRYFEINLYEILTEDLKIIIKKYERQEKCL